MSVLALLARKWNYSVENPGVGRVLYREGNREYTFPIYCENDEIVLVGVPSSQRIHFFFNWYAHPQEFSAAARDRILPRIAQYLRATGAQVRVFERARLGEDFDFYPELFAARGIASELLEEAGCTWFRDYGSIDLLHAEYGLEICGIQNEADVKVIAETLRRGFPHWHHQNICLHDQGREPGLDRIALHVPRAFLCFRLVRGGLIRSPDSTTRIKKPPLLLKQRTCLAQDGLQRLRKIPADIFQTHAAGTEFP